MGKTKVTKADRAKYMELCNKVFDKLAERLKKSHVIVSSPFSNDRYLVLKGDEKKVTNYGKPCFSFRVSDHWNWRSDLRYCVDPNFIQCYTEDLRKAFPRREPGKSSAPVLACSVAYQGLDHKYHVIYGEKYDKDLKHPVIINTDEETVVYDAIDDIYEDMSLLNWLGSFPILKQNDEED